jgi:nitroreductase
MEKPAPANYEIHDLLRRRWSPRAFAERPVEREKIHSLLEAARWAPSSFNQQPWYFIVATREEPEEFEKMLGALVERNREWAGKAPVLLLAAAKLNFDQTGKPNRHAYHDVGLAMGSLAVEAVALGLFAHMMAGILPEKARELYSVPEGYEVITGAAIGYPGEAAELPESFRAAELAERKRKPLESFVFSGTWGQASPLTK